MLPPDGPGLRRLAVFGWTRAHLRRAHPTRSTDVGGAAWPTVGDSAQATGIGDRLGLKPGMVVQELGWDEDTDDELRVAIEDVIDASMVDGDYGNVVDAVLLWWRNDDGDLVDGLVDTLADLVGGGSIWLLTPKVGRPRSGRRRRRRGGPRRSRASRRPRPQRSARTGRPRDWSRRRPPRERPRPRRHRLGHGVRPRHDRARARPCRRDPSLRTADAGHHRSRRGSSGHRPGRRLRDARGAIAPPGGDRRRTRRAHLG